MVSEAPGEGKPFSKMLKTVLKKNLDANLAVEGMKNPNTRHKGGNSLEHADPSSVFNLPLDNTRNVLPVPHAYIYPSDTETDSDTDTELSGTERRARAYLRALSKPTDLWQPDSFSKLALTAEIPSSSSLTSSRRASATNAIESVQAKPASPTEEKLPVESETAYQGA